MITGNKFFFFSFFLRNIGLLFGGGERKEKTPAASHDTRCVIMRQASCDGQQVTTSRKLRQGAEAYSKLKAKQCLLTVVNFKNVKLIKLLLLLQWASRSIIILLKIPCQTR